MIKKKIHKWLLIAVVLALTVYFISDSIAYKNALKKAANPADAQTKIVVIKKGTSAKGIGMLLQDKGIILDADVFYRYVKDTNQAEKLLSGRFELNPSLTVPKIALILVDPKKAKNAVTIPEGYSLQQIDELLTKNEFIQKNEFLQAAKNFSQYDQYPFLMQGQSLEGFLFPDTYFLEAGDFVPGKLIGTMLQTFEKKVIQKMPAFKTAEMTPGKQITVAEKPRTIEEILTIASMLEKEVRTPKDFPIVAGIMWKRIDNGWYLNIDATSLYSDSEQYDTYKSKKIPPTPIGNPGVAMIEAALNPTSSPYWFYLTKPGTGEVVYAQTNDEQNANRATYLRGT